MNGTIGLDISKGRLDAHWLPYDEHRQFFHDRAGVKALALWAQKVGIAQMIFESTGVYHRRVETGLAQHDISFARANPRQTRRFAEGAGPLAKTERVDAAMLAKMGAFLGVKADTAKRESHHDLKQLATARHGTARASQRPDCGAGTAGRNRAQPPNQADRTTPETDRTRPISD